MAAHLLATILFSADDTTVVSTNHGRGSWMRGPVAAVELFDGGVGSTFKKQREGLCYMQLAERVMK